MKISCGLCTFWDKGQCRKHAPTVSYTLIRSIHAVRKGLEQELAPLPVRLLHSPISEILNEIPIRVRTRMARILEEYGIEKVNRLVMRSKQQLRAMKGFGKTMFMELERALKKKELFLGMRDRQPFPTYDADDLWPVTRPNDWCGQFEQKNFQSTLE